MQSINFASIRLTFSEFYIVVKYNSHKKILLILGQFWI